MTTARQAIEAAAALAGSPALAAFVTRFYRGVPEADLLDRPPEALLAAAASLWAFAAERAPGTPKLRLLPGARPVVELVTDDMPFLITSLTEALADQGLRLHLVIHPVETTRRHGAHRSEDGVAMAESTMHIELEGEAGPDRAPAIEARLRATLADVRTAVDALPALKRAAASMAAAAPDPESAAFLAWLAEGNFLFLGYREYDLTPAGPAIRPGQGIGLLADDTAQAFEGLRDMARASGTVQTALFGPEPLLVVKAGRRSPIARPALMDAIVLKSFDGTRVTGLRLLLGLFSRASLQRPAQDIPVLRRTLARCLDRAGFAPDSFDGQALRRILDGFSHDDLFQLDENRLFDTAMAILQLRLRPRIRLFLWRDPFDRFATALVFLPADRLRRPVPPAGHGAA